MAATEVFKILFALWAMTGASMLFRQ